LKSTTGLCGPIDTSPTDFSEIDTSDQFVTPSNWVVSSNSSGAPLLGLIGADSVLYRLAWNSAPKYSSLSKTIFSAFMQFNTGRTLGLGVRLGQGTNRETDGIQWVLTLPSESSNTVSASWNLVWYNSLLNYGEKGTLPWQGGSSAWHNVKITSTSTTIDNVQYQVTQIDVDGTSLPTQTVRPFDMIGGAYLYAIGGTPFFRNLMLVTSSTVLVSIQNCLSASQLQTLIQTALKASIADIKVSNVTDRNGLCVAQNGNFNSNSNKKKKQIAEVVGNGFTVEISSTVVSSEALVSQFMELGLSWSSVFAPTGGILSITPAPFADLRNELGISNLINLEDLDQILNPGVKGMSNGEIAGIVVGSVVGAVILVGVLGLVVAGIVVVMRKRKGWKSGGVVERNSMLDIQTKPVEDNECVLNTPGRGAKPEGVVVGEREVEDVDLDEAGEDEDDLEQGRRGVNVFDMNRDRSGSLTYRMEGRVDGNMNIQ